MYTILDDHGEIKANISKESVKDLLKYRKGYVKVFKNLGREYIQVTRKFDFDYGFIRLSCHPNYFIREEL